MNELEHVLAGDSSDGRFFESLAVELLAQFINLPSSRIDSALDDALRRLCREFDLDRSTLWQRSGAPDALLLAHIIQPEEWPKLAVPRKGDLVAPGDWALNAAKDPRVYGAMRAKAFFPWTFEQMRCGRTVAISCLDDLPPAAALDREVFHLFGTLSTVVVPLRIGQELLGCVSFARMREEGSWSARMVNFFELVAHIFANALARKAFEQSRRENQDILHAVLDNAAEGIITVNSSGIIESANFAATRMFGYHAQELTGRNIRVLMPAPFSERDDNYLAAYMLARNSGIPGIGRELTALRKDGSTFSVELTVSESIVEGRQTFTGVLCDLTEKKLFEDSLRESESRFRNIADSAPILIWIAGLDKKCTFVNKPWLDFRGRSMEQEQGDGWVLGLHPDDQLAALRTYEDAFDERSVFVMQYRLHRHDGQFRWISAHGVPRYDADGRFIGYIGSCVDITERIEAEQAARDLNGRLINAMENERARVGRELLDDVSQRLARLAIDVGRLQSVPSCNAKVGGLISGIHDELVRLSDDVHNISYELHPSALIDLGLDDALKAECDRFSKQAAVPIKVNFHNLPSSIPRDAALGFYRIAQESLNNAVRHGRATRIEVTLRGLDEGLQLAVCDDGIGIDPSRNLHRPSLGLAGMKERARLLGGELDVESEYGHGTTIVAWIPLTEKYP